MSHRDIKPDNIGVGQTPAGKLTLILFDFSLAHTPVDNIRAGTPLPGPLPAAPQAATLGSVCRAFCHGHDPIRNGYRRAAPSGAMANRIRPCWTATYRWTARSSTRPYATPCPHSLPRPCTVIIASVLTTPRKCGGPGSASCGCRPAAYRDGPRRGDRPGAGADCRHRGHAALDPGSASQSAGRPGSHWRSDDWRTAPVTTHPVVPQSGDRPADRERNSRPGRTRGAALCGTRRPAIAWSTGRVRTARSTG